MKTVFFIASDHAGYAIKSQIISSMSGMYDFVDIGTKTDRSCDYPIIARKTVKSYLHFTKKSKPDYQGNVFMILICGSGVGMSITANRNRYIRAALCISAEGARLSREHNDANCLCIASRVSDIETAKSMIQTFDETKFLGGRHARRIRKINPRIYQRTFFSKAIDIVKKVLRIDN